METNSLHSAVLCDNQLGSALLSGKMLLRNSKVLLNYERSLQLEEDSVTCRRIESLMQLLANCDTEEVKQMVMNSLIFHKNFCIQNVELQNKIEGKTLQKLIKALLICTSYRRDFDHLNSMIKTLPHYRKLQFLNNYIDAANSAENKLKECEVFVCATILLELLQTELVKEKSASIELLSLYINLAIVLAHQEPFIDRQIEKIFLQATDMRVSSQFYYVAADLLRLKMPNRHEDFVIKLISIGLSHDISELQEVKYSMRNEESDKLDKVHLELNGNMFKALMILAVILNNFSLKRFCIEAASVCEPDSTFAKEILGLIPASSRDAFRTKLTEPLRAIREQLEFFKTAIVMDVPLLKAWEQMSISFYDRLDYLNHRVEMNELPPLTYPGVEKNLKRLRIDSESTEELNGQSTKIGFDAKKVLSESQEFAKIISNRLKQLKNPFKITEAEEVSRSSEINENVIIKVLNNSNDFSVQSNGILLMKLSSELSDYEKQFNAVSEEQNLLNEASLLFDFDTREVKNESSLSSIYQKGLVPVQDLLKSYNIFDISNVLIYTIAEKKMLYMQQEFVDFNRNQQNAEANQVQAAFAYLNFRNMRQQRFTMSSLSKRSMLESYIENHSFDAKPGQYKCLSIGNAKPKINEATPAAVISSRALKSEEVIGDSSIASTPIIHASSESHTTQQSQNTQQKMRRDKIPVIQLAVGETFHASDEIIQIFKWIENELSNQLKETATFDLKQFCDEKSAHKVGFTQPHHFTTDFNINVQRRRNNQTGPASVASIKLPARVHGALKVIHNFTDTIVYDENMDNPQIQSDYEINIQGPIAIDHVTHNIKNIEVECFVRQFKSIIKITLRSGSRSKPKSSDSPKALQDSSFQSSPNLKSFPSSAIMSPTDSPKAQELCEDYIMNSPIESHQCSLEVPAATNSVQITTPSELIGTYLSNPSTTTCPKENSNTESNNIQNPNRESVVQTSCDEVTESKVQELDIYNPSTSSQQSICDLDSQREISAIKFSQETMNTDALDSIDFEDEIRSTTIKNETGIALHSAPVTSSSFQVYQINQQSDESLSDGVIDLTEESDIKSREASKDMFSSGLTIKENDINEEYRRVSKKLETKNMRPAPDFTSDEWTTDLNELASRFNLPKCHVSLFDVTANIDKQNMTTNMKVRIEPVSIKLSLNEKPFCTGRKDYQLNNQEEALPLEDSVVDDIRQTTFQIVDQNSETNQPMET